MSRKLVGLASVVTLSEVGLYDDWSSNLSVYASFL